MQTPHRSSADAGTKKKKKELLSKQPSIALDGCRGGLGVFQLVVVHRLPLVGGGGGGVRKEHRMHRRKLAVDHTRLIGTTHQSAIGGFENRARGFSQHIPFFSPSNLLLL